MGWVLLVFAIYCFLVTVDGIMVYNSDLYSLIEDNGYKKHNFDKYDQDKQEFEYEYINKYSIDADRVSIFGSYGNVFSQIVGGWYIPSYRNCKTEIMVINELKSKIRRSLFLSIPIGLLCGFLFYRIIKTK